MKVIQGGPSGVPVRSAFEVCDRYVNQHALSGGSAGGGQGSDCVFNGCASFVNADEVSPLAVDGRDTGPFAADEVGKSDRVVPFERPPRKHTATSANLARNHPFPTTPHAPLPLPVRSQPDACSLLAPPMPHPGYPALRMTQR